MIKAMENNFSRVIYHNTKEFKNNNMDKESLLNLMINSIDNFNTAQGKYRYLSKTGGYDLDIEFQVNYNDTPTSYEKNISLLPSDVENKIVETAFDGKMYSSYARDENESAVLSMNKEKKDELIAQKKLYQLEVIAPEESESEATDFRSRAKYTSTGINVIRRADPAFMQISKTVLMPEDFAIGIMGNDFSKWSITGSEKIQGRDTFVINGQFYNGYKERYESENYKLNIDKETGILLFFEAKNNAGKTNQLIQFSELKIDDQISDNLSKKFSMQ